MAGFWAIGRGAGLAGPRPGPRALGGGGAGIFPEGGLGGGLLGALLES